MRSVIQPVVADLGWEPVPDEPERCGTLRARLLAALGTVGADPDVRATAALRFSQFLDDPSSLPPDLVTAVLAIVSYSGGESEYDLLLQRFRDAATPQDEIRFLYALAAPERPDLLRRTLDLALSSEVRSQDAPYLIGSILGSRTGAALAWPFIGEHWDTIRARFPDNSIPRMLDAISAVVDPALAHGIHAFLVEHPVPQEKLVAQSLEKLDNSVAFATRVAPDLPAAAPGFVGGHLSGTPAALAPA